MHYAPLEVHEYLLDYKWKKCLKVNIAIYRQVRG